MELMSFLIIPTRPFIFGTISIIIPPLIGTRTFVWSVPRFHIPVQANTLYSFFFYINHRIWGLAFLVLSGPLTPILSRQGRGVNVEIAALSRQGGVARNDTSRTFDTLVLARLLI
jgi:hypothetical protein